MQTASPISFTFTRDGSAGPEEVNVVEVSAVAALIGEYDAALAIPFSEPELRAAALEYARANAALRLAQWSVVE